MQMCAACSKLVTHSKSTSPPTLAIANGNYIGRLIERFDLSRTDEQAIALVSSCVSMSTVTGGPCRTIKSHHYIVENTEGPIVSMLPGDMADRVRVAMTGCMTPAQVAACKKRYELNVPHCREALAFLYDNNTEYAEYRERRGGEAVGAVLQGNTQLEVVIDNSKALGEGDNHDEMTDAIRDDSCHSRLGSTVLEGANEALECIWEDRSSLLLVPNQSQESPYTDILVRKSNKYVSMQAWASCVRMFPTLFPGGRGGPLERRRTHISVKRWINRCLRVHGHRFEEHYAFLLLAFDYLATESACQTLFVKMHVSTRALKAAKISHHTLKTAMDYYTYLTKAKSKGMRARPPPPEVEEVVKIRRGLRTPESAFWGSNLSRMRARHDLFGLLKPLGPMQLFFTVSPDSAGTYSISIKSGVVASDAVRKANLTVLPNRAERRAISAKHPVECARYFVRVVEIVIGTMLGWDAKRGKPRRGGGIFGVVRAFAAAAETQIAGDLHSYFVVWLHGFPQTSSALQSAVKEDVSFRHRLIQLADAVLTAKPPCLEKENGCPNCHEVGGLTAVLPGVDAFRRPAPGSTAPTTAKCSICGTCFGDKDIINAAIDALADRESVQVVAQNADNSRCRPPQDQESSLAVSLAVRDVQVHFWNHTRSCFKVMIQTPKGSVCRFLKPERPHEGHTAIDNESGIELHRPIGCEYVNAFNPTLMAVLKCNHDVQFVLCRETTNTAAYVCKYCIKHQNQVENYAALSVAASAKAANKAGSLPSNATELQRRKRILGSMLYAVTNGQELAAPMAALYVLRGSPFWMSHDPVRVDLGVMLCQQGEYKEISVPTAAVSKRKTTSAYISRRNELEKYWCRDQSYEAVSFIDFCEQDTGRMSASSKRTSQDQEDAGIEADTLVAIKRKVLVICGNEIPDISDHISSKKSAFYYSAILTLFKPHRELTLLQTNRTPLESYRAFIDSGDSSVIRRLHQFEARLRNYYKVDRLGQSSALETAESQILRTRSPTTTAWTRPEAQMPDDCGGDYDIPDSADDPLVAPPIALTTEKLAEKARTAVDGVPNLRRAVDVAVSMYPVVDRLELGADFEYSNYNALVAKPIVDDSDEDSSGTDAFIGAFPDAPTRLDRFQECFCPVPWDEPAPSPQWTRASLPAFPSIAVTSEAFHMNFWQHAMFEVAARHLLHAYSADVADVLREPMYPASHRAEPYEIRPQLIAYLGGEAGTGKSTVVHALLAFPKMWGREGSVETLAFTGVAAINVKGRTMHSARNLRLNGAQNNPTPTVEMKSRFTRVVLVIIDEISMTDQALLGGTDPASRSLAGNTNKIMGGRHIMLIGDWLQLPSVAGSPCFVAPPPSAPRAIPGQPKAESNATLRQAGFGVYSAINFVVFLTENMRAKSDPDYTQLLSDLRWDRLSDSQLATLNSRVEISASSESTGAENFHRPVVVSTNELRAVINRDMTFKTAKRLKLPIYECLAIPSERSKPIIDHIVDLNDDQTERIPIRLLFFIGMPVMVTRKHPDLLEADVIANGVHGTVVGFSPDKDSSLFATTRIGETVVHTFKPQSKLLLIKIHGCAAQLVKGFPVGVIGVPPLRAPIKIPRIPHLSQASLTIQQFAVVPAFACTTEKLQGQTCTHGIIVTPLDRRKSVPRQRLYIALSRSISLRGVALTEPITKKYLAMFKPKQAVVSEMDRLVHLIALPPYISLDQVSEFEQWKKKQSMR